MVVAPAMATWSRPARCSNLCPCGKAIPLLPLSPIERKVTRPQIYFGEQSNEYVAPVVRVMNESEVLSAFQVNAAGTMGWWMV